MEKAKTLYLLVGPPGAGKSQYAGRELRAVARVSQDEMGRAHLKAFRERLESGCDVVVDRMNFDRMQRARYVGPARALGYRVVCVWFDVDRTVCLRRLAGRTGHPTVSADDDHERLVDSYFRTFVRPAEDEYDELRVVSRRAYAKVLDIRGECGGRRAIVVGDIHGCYDEFMLLLRKCRHTEEDVVVSVGDVADRGPKSKETLEWFRGARRAYVVEGNHCNKARRHWSGRRVKVSHGLDRTIEQCAGMDHAALAAWMATWPQIIRVPDVGGLPAYVVHAGVDGRRPIGRQKVEDCLYARRIGGRDYFDESAGWWYDTLDGSYVVMSGHAVHEDPRPSPCAYALDGGACHGGKLRALVLDGGLAELVEVDGAAYAEPDPPGGGASGHTGMACPVSGSLGAVEARDALVAAGLLRRDDLGDLSVYTYTDACTFGREWNGVTLNSRGHIFDRRTGECVAWSFRKFFNVGETPETQESLLPWSSGYAVFEKLDGWLGNLYRTADGFAVATRGSFHSDGARWATQFLREHHDLAGLPDEVTLVFELISPITRIIVDYGTDERLSLLAAFNRRTGEEYPWATVVGWASQFGFPLPKVYGGDISECRRLLADSSGKEMEGFVVRFANGLRVKVKGEDYLRRAYIVSNLTPLSVWGAMSGGRVAPEYRGLVDADYRDCIDGFADALEGAWRRVAGEIEEDFASLNRTGDRRSFADSVKSPGLRHAAAMFARLDGKQQNVDKYIMKLIRPHGNEIPATE